MELVEYIVPSESEPRTFAKFTITVPSIVLLIKGGKVQFEQRITIVQRYGNTHLGNFATVTDLNVAYPPSETLDDNNDVAFVYSNESGETAQVGFYRLLSMTVQITLGLKKKLYFTNKAIQRFRIYGECWYGNPSGVPTISESVIYQLMQELSYQSVKIDLLETEMEEAQLDISNIENGTTIVEKAKRDQNGNVIDETYATKAN